MKMEFQRWILLFPVLCACANGISRSFTTNETSKIKQAQNAGKLYRNFKKLQKTNPVSTTTFRPIMSREDLKSYNSNIDNRISSKSSYSSSTSNKYDVSNRTFMKGRVNVNSNPWYEDEPKRGKRKPRRGQESIAGYTLNQYGPPYNGGHRDNRRVYDKTSVYNNADYVGYNDKQHNRNDRNHQNQLSRRRRRINSGKRPPPYYKRHQNRYHDQPPQQHYDYRYGEPPPSPPPPPPYRRRVREPPKHHRSRGRYQNFPRDRRHPQQYDQRDSFHPPHRQNNMKPPPSYFENAGPPPPPPTPVMPISPPLPPTPRTPRSYATPSPQPRYMRRRRGPPQRSDNVHFEPAYYSGKGGRQSKPPRIRFKKPQNHHDRIYDYRPPIGRGPERRPQPDPYYDQFYQNRHRHEQSHYIRPPTTTEPPTAPPTPPGFLFRMAEDLDIL